uniref:Uncharacterized protein n=1 Tax=viral metagenome TaxID=1070528 RepID=A0A6C0CJ19_9ZZZZ
MDESPIDPNKTYAHLIITEQQRLIYERITQFVQPGTA